MTRHGKTAKLQPTLRPGDREYLSALQSANVAERLPYVNWALYLMVLFVLAVFGWAMLARVDVVTKADGRIIPDGREQTIASLEGGILRELNVHEGMEVKAGDIVAQLDPTRVAALQSEDRSRQLALLATLARLRAEMTGEPLAFPAQVQAVPRIVQGETATFNARRRALQDALESTEQSLVLMRRELKVAQSMAAGGLMPEVEVMRLRRQVGELEQQSQDRTNQFRELASAEQVRVQTELASLDDQLVVRDDALERTVLRSPVRGLVKNIRVNTVGGIVAAGSPIMEIVPLGGRVLVEARIRPADIGFVREGQPAKVKLSAYEYNTYGGLSGTVEYISPDALGDAERSNTPDATWYRARIAADVSTLRWRGEALPVRPGMTGSVEISTSDRSVMSYLLRPMLRGQEAFREQ